MSFLLNLKDVEEEFPSMKRKFKPMDLNEIATTDQAENGYTNGKQFFTKPSLTQQFLNSSFNNNLCPLSLDKAIRDYLESIGKYDFLGGLQRMIDIGNEIHKGKYAGVRFRK